MKSFVSLDAMLLILLMFMLAMTEVSEADVAVDNARDTVGTSSEMHDRLSVVLSDPIVALAQGIFHSLKEFDQINYKNVQKNHDKMMSKSIEQDAEKVGFKPKIVDKDEVKDEKKIEEESSINFMNEIHRYTMEEYFKDVKEYINMPNIVNKTRLDKNALETSIQTLENFLYNEISEFNKSLSSKDDNFPNIYKQSSDLFSGDERSPDHELFPGNGDGLWVLNDFSPELSPKSAPIFTEKEKHTLIPFSYENASKFEDHSVHPEITNHLTTDDKPIVKYPLEIVDEHDMTDKDEISSPTKNDVQVHRLTKDQKAHKMETILSEKEVFQNEKISGEMGYFQNGAYKANSSDRPFNEIETSERIQLQSSHKRKKMTPMKYMLRNDIRSKERKWKSRPQRNKIKTKRFNTKHNAHVHNKKIPVNNRGESTGSTKKERQEKETKQKVNVKRNKSYLQNKLVKSYASKNRNVLKSKPWINTDLHRKNKHSGKRKQSKSKYIMHRTKAHPTITKYSKLLTPTLPPRPQMQIHSVPVTVKYYSGLNQRDREYSEKVNKV